MKNIKKNQQTKKASIKKIPDVEKFDKMFKDIQIQPNKNNGSDFTQNEQSTWIVSDNNSSFKSVINYG